MIHGVHTFESISGALRETQEKIEIIARGYGLDLFPTIYELVSADQLHAVAAYGGFPTRYPHWRFGMEYERLSKTYTYGLQKIYELVINNDPCYAYLLDNNTRTDHKMVMAHVCGHNDFFKNNAYFQPTNRKMVDEMANHGNRIRRYMDRFGQEAVENFIDSCLSIEDLIDIHSPFMGKRSEPTRYEFQEALESEAEVQRPPRFPSKSYMDSFINPASLFEAEAEARENAVKPARRIPEEPTRDVMQFLLDHAPLRPWQMDILSIIRDEAYYFAPQGQTKIMNEGWATYWHSTIMTQHICEPAEIICYADHCAATLATSRGRLNPYKLGVELFRDIEERWDRGQFGPEYAQCEDWRERWNWNTHAGLGREKIFEVRRVHCDLTFLDEFLTPEFCERRQLFSFEYNPHTSYYEIESREFREIKNRLLKQLANLGRPRITLIDGNYRNRSELYLRHDYDGVELKMDYARETLTHLHRLWTRPVHLETVENDYVVVLSYDGVSTTSEKKELYQPPASGNWRGEE